MEAMTAICSVVDFSIVIVGRTSESWVESDRDGTDGAGETVSHGGDGNIDTSSSEAGRRGFLRTGLSRNRACCMIVVPCFRYSQAGPRSFIYGGLFTQQKRMNERSLINVLIEMFA